MALISVVCTGCSTPFEYERKGPNLRKWCSESCRVRSYRASPGSPRPVIGSDVHAVCSGCGCDFTFTWTGHRARTQCDQCRWVPDPSRPAVGEMATAECIGCGSTFGYERKRARARRWCSETCRVRTWEENSRTPEMLERARLRKNERKRLRTREQWAPRPCVICGCEFRKQRNALYCSTKCRWRSMHVAAKASGTKKRTQQAYLARRRAAGLPVANWTPARAAADGRRRAQKLTTTIERFTPEEIYDRDGWQCQLCGKSVDPTLKHPDPMSATQDHAVPLSIGGPHTRANVQLAHLRCNLKKRDGVFGSGEQLRLVG
jgi:hypothetical protein